MIKKQVFVLLFNLFVGSCYSQISFYLRPEIYMKTNSGNLGPGLYKSNIRPNKDFTFQNHGIFFDRNQLNLGINCGVNWKKKHLFEFGIHTDQSGITTTTLSNNFHALGLSFGGTSANIHTLSVSQPYLRFDFNYQNNFYNNKPNTIGLRFIVGTGVLFNRHTNPKKGIYQVDSFDGWGVGEVSPNVYITEEIHTSRSFYRTSMYLRLGMGIDFNVKLKKKNRLAHLFSFDITYLANFKPMQSRVVNIKMLDVATNNTYKYLYLLQSNGSGFYFSISRKFQLYPFPWKLKKKKKKV